MSTAERIDKHSGEKLRAAAEMVHRSFAGPIGCVFAVAVLLFSTSLPREHPIATWLFVAAMFVRLAPRFARQLLRERGRKPAIYPMWMIAASAVLLSLPSGLFAAFVILRYGFASWNTLFVFVFAMSCAISAASAAAPNRTLVLAFEAMLLLPIIAACFLLQGPHSLVAGFSVAGFTVYVMIHANRLSSDYWKGLAAERELNERAQELQAARIAADAASEAKSRFLAHMSHEIRTPMNGVLGMIDLVLENDLSAGQREHLGYARQAAHSLLTLLNDLLDHSKAESGKLLLEQIDFPVRQVVADAVSPFLVQATAKNVHLTWDAEENVPEFVSGDPTRLRQILINLVSNSIKFTESGSIRVSASIERIAGNCALLHFRVADTGSGIPREKLSEIFEAFSQADDSVTRRFGGTGLGLAICRDLVGIMGGRIWAESSLGHGSVFHFNVRFAVTANHSVSGCSAGNEPLASQIAPMRILVVEDNLINQKLLLGLLSRDGHCVELAGNGEQALTKVRDQQFDLVLMDVQMPVMDGLEATRRIRNSEISAGTHLPVIGVTAGASSADVEACRACGMDSFLSKPIMAAELRKVLSDVSKGLSDSVSERATEPASRADEISFTSSASELV